ncbi:transglycosylase SLT domain-containing protein [Chitinophaga polysaccharea]|nr:transglycosylase SLT domain-containing protein [Chitinophaga polysaccharea]
MYIPYIAIVLRDYGLPDDLKYIALAESRLKKHVQSPVGAGGMWQFMPSTATGEGLAVEERNQVIKSTHAACRLLRKLYSQLHSWPLVVAAYNYGIGNVMKAVKKQHTSDYYALQLNEETANYLFQILAFKILYQQQFEPAIQDPSAGKDYTTDSPVIVEQKETFNSMVFSSGGKIAQPSADSVIVAAFVLKDSYVANSGRLAFNTAADLHINGVVIPAGSVMRGMAYSQSAGRVLIAVEGIEVAAGLNDYAGTVYATDGRPGLYSSGKSSVIPAGERVTIKFIRQ